MKKTILSKKKTAESAFVDLLELTMFIQLCPTFLLQIPTEDSLKQTSIASAAMYFYTKDFLKSLNTEQQVNLEEILESFWALVLIFPEEPSMLGHARTMNHCLGSNKHKMSESNQLSVFSLWTIQKPFPTNEGWLTNSHNTWKETQSATPEFVRWTLEIWQEKWDDLSTSRTTHWLLEELWLCDWA